MGIVVLALAAALAGCKPKPIDLGKPDAAVDAFIDAPADAASFCRCRLTPCRLAGDCALIGGACGADFYCVGDFGPCTTAAQCQAIATGSVCTQGATSTAACP